MYTMIYSKYMYNLIVKGYDDLLNQSTGDIKKRLELVEDL